MVSVNLLCSVTGCHVARVGYVISAWIRSGHGIWADIRVEECGLALELSQAPRDRLQPCSLNLSKSGLSRYPVFLYNYVQ